MDNDQALEQFEQAWRAARPLDLRQVVARFGGESSTPHGRRQLAHELVMIDSAPLASAARPRRERLVGRYHHRNGPGYFTSIAPGPDIRA
jgi:hypothetical protein